MNGGGIKRFGDRAAGPPSVAALAALASGEAAGRDYAIGRGSTPRSRHYHSLCHSRDMVPLHPGDMIKREPVHVDFKEATLLGLREPLQCEQCYSFLKPRCLCNTGA